LTPKGRDRVVSYLLALCLAIEGDYTLEPTLVAADLRETKTKCARSPHAGQAPHLGGTHQGAHISLSLCVYGVQGV
jgi:hypothetical protein